MVSVHFTRPVAVARLICAAALLLACARPSVADWPHLRGPHYDGVSRETGLAPRWPAEGPPQLWQRDLGQGHSGFIVAQGRLYTQRQTFAGQAVLCLAPDTGETIWETRYDWAWQPRGAYPGPYATPTWHAGKVYYSSPSGIVGCLDATSGAAIWSVNVKERFKGKGYGFGYAITPLVENDLVILPVGGEEASVVALHVDDGKVVWSSGSDPASYCPVLPITLGGRRCVVAYLQNALAILDLATGEILHRHPLSTGYDEHSAWPIYREPYLLLAASFRAPAALYAVRAGPDGKLQCVPRWSKRILANDVSSSVLIGDHLFGFDLHQLQSSKHRPSRGVFKCLDWDSGAAAWETDKVGHASLAAADGKLFLLNDSGELILAKADPAAFQELGRVRLFDDEICWTPPTLWKGRLFVRSPSRGVCLFVGEPDALPSGVTTTKITPQPRGWKIGMFWLFGRERDFPNDAFSERELFTWFTACLAILAAAVPLSWLVRVCIRRTLGREIASLPTYWGWVILMGLLGPAVGGVLWETMLFTWPVCLFAVFQCVVFTACWAAQDPHDRRRRWLARLGFVALLAAGYGFYSGCALAGMFVGWTFLFGFLTALPVSLLAGWAWLRERAAWIVASITIFAFAMFFWGAQALLLWKGAVQD